MTRNFPIYGRTWRTFLLVAITVTSAYSSAAQSSAPLPRPLPLEDVLQYALDHYPAVRAALERVTAAHAGVAVARATHLPQFSGVYQDSRATQNQVPGIWLPTPMPGTPLTVTAPEK